MTTLAQSVWMNALADLAHARTAQERGVIVRRAAQLAGNVSLQTAYTHLKALGWVSGRKPRVDKGSSTVTTEHLREVAAVMATGRNARGECNISTSEALNILAGQGAPVGELSYSHITRRLREEGLDTRTMRAPTPCISRVSKHPNHVWQIDISTCLQWDFEDKETGRKLRLFRDGGARFNKNKLENLDAKRLTIKRFMATDHYSGAFFVRYYYTTGERAEDVVDFIWHAIHAKDEVGAAYPFRGIPRRLVTDQGGGFKAGLVQQLLGENGLQVQVEHHESGNARATGSVERAHAVWQGIFEGKLSLDSVSNLDELNHRALQELAVVNAERIHSRTNTTRSGLWATIRPEQLREAPSAEVYWSLAQMRPKEGTLEAHNWLRAGKRCWYVSGEHVHPKQKVLWRLTPFQHPGLRVWDQFGRELQVSEIVLDQSGQVASGAPHHVWDDEDAKGSSIPAAPAQRLAQGIQKGTVDVPALDIWPTVEERLGNIAFRPVVGTPFEAPAVTAPVLPALDCKLQIARRLGTPLGLHPDGPWLIEQVGEGLTQAALDALCADYEAASIPVVPHLREVR